MYAQLNNPASSEPLHYIIPLMGAIPEVSICINRSLSTSSKCKMVQLLVIADYTVNTASSNFLMANVTHTRREIEGGNGLTASTLKNDCHIGSFRSADVAYRVMAKCTGIIKERLSLHPIIDKLVEHRMINEYEKSQVLDDHSGLNTNQRMEKLLNFVKASIKEDGEEFGLFVDLIKQENTRRGDRLAKELQDTYEQLLID